MNSKLENILSNVNGATFISLSTSTIPALTGGKKNPMQGRVRKHNTGAQIMVFQNKNSSGYENMVKRRLEKEGKSPGSFKVGERKWGTRIPNMPIVEHKGEQYLEVIFLSTGKTTYTLDDAPIDVKKVEGLKNISVTGQGGLNDQVIIRTFKASNITELKIAGKVYAAADLT